MGLIKNKSSSMNFISFLDIIIRLTVYLIFSKTFDTDSNIRLLDGVVVCGLVLPTRECGLDPDLQRAYFLP